MKNVHFACLFLSLITAFTTLLWPQSNALVDQGPKGIYPIGGSQTNPKEQFKVLDSYGKLPLSFEANRGQVDSQVKFVSRASGYTLFLTWK